MDDKKVDEPGSANQDAPEKKETMVTSGPKYVMAHNKHTVGQTTRYARGFPPLRGCVCLCNNLF